MPKPVITNEQRRAGAMEYSQYVKRDGSPWVPRSTPWWDRADRLEANGHVLKRHTDEWGVEGCAVFKEDPDVEWSRHYCTCVLCGGRWGGSDDTNQPCSANPPTPAGKSCPDCEGSGQKTSLQFGTTPEGFTTLWDDCPICDGTGEIEEE